MPSVRAPMDRDESISVSVRRIDNGYLVRRSRDDGDSYTSTETFSKDRPALEVEPARSVPDERAMGGKAMKAAVAAARR